MNRSDIPLELRFPKRLEKVRQIAVEIARTVGEFGDIPDIGGGRPPQIARLDRFHIEYFTPFNQPARWMGPGWDPLKVRLFLHSLVIRQGMSICLQVVWDNEGIRFDRVRPPSKDNWDRRLRKLGRKVQRHLRA